MFLSILNDCIVMLVPQLRVSSYRMPIPEYLRSMIRRNSDAWIAANVCGEANRHSLMEKLKTLNETFEKKFRRTENNRLGIGSFIKYLCSKPQFKGRIGTLVGAHGQVAKTNIQKLGLLAAPLKKHSLDRMILKPLCFPTAKDFLLFNSEEIHEILSK